MHTCPDCGQACYCHGDIEDHDTGEDDLCAHDCDDWDGEDDDAQLPLEWPHAPPPHP